MILYPAIDLKDGRCVRLLRGDMEQATVYNEDPAAQAGTFRAQGFDWIHVVDLNGAFEGRAVNGDAVESILAAVDLKIQLGGGIRTLESIEGWLARGVERVVLGTVAVHDPDLAEEACRKFPGRIAIAVDARRGRVAVSGWAEATDVAVLSVAERFENCGATAFVYTDIERDGAKEGVNVAAISALAQSITTPVIASGGVASLDDLRALKEHESEGIEGVIAGRALYDGSIVASEALALLAE